MTLLLLVLLLSSSTDAHTTVTDAHTTATDAQTTVTCGGGANCSAILQGAIDAGADFTVAGAFVVSQPLLLRSSHQTITFAPGSSVTAQRGAFHGKNDCLFAADNVEDLTILAPAGGDDGMGVGNNNASAAAVWSMQRADYANASLYAPSEWRHALSIMSSVRVAVRGLRIAETGGDGVYVYGSVGVELRDIVTDGAYRNGLSIISARDLAVRGCRFVRTAGTPPQAGIDIEPNNCKPNRSCFEYLANVSITDVEARQNAGTGLSFSLGKLAPNATIDVRVENATIVGAAAAAPPPLAWRGDSGSGDPLAYNIGVYVGGKKVLGAGPAARGTIVLANVSVSGTAQPGLEVFGKLAAGALTTLRRCRFANVGTAPLLRWGGQNVPMLLHQSAVGAVGGLVFDECSVADTAPRPFLKCDSCSPTGRGPATAISGNVSVSNPHGCTVSLGPSPVNVSLAILSCSNQTSAAEAKMFKLMQY